MSILRDRDVGVNIRQAGEDIRKGARVLAAGVELGPAELGVLASLAVSHPLVYRQPRVAILGSGDEIVDVDQPEEILSGRKVGSSNTHTLMALVRRTGAEPVNLRHRPAIPGEPAGAFPESARLRSAGHHGRHQRRRARLRARRVGRAGGRAALLEAADASGSTGGFRAAGQDPLDRSSGKSGQHDGDVRAVRSPGDPQDGRTCLALPACGSGAVNRSQSV